MKPLRQLILFIAVLLSVSVGQAQGFVPGETPGTTPPFVPPGEEGGTTDPLDGAGDLDNIIGSLGDLIDDFDWDNFISFACQAVAAAGDDTLCEVEQFYEEVMGISEDSDEIIDVLAQEIFGGTSAFDLFAGNFFTETQITDFEARIQTALGSENPQEAVTLARELFNEAAQAEFNNYASAPEGTLEATANGVMNYSPNLRATQALGLRDLANNQTAQFQTMADLQASADIADLQLESEFPNALAEGIQEGVAPNLREEANTAVSTRATVQEVVNAITRYMEQDVDQFAYLSEQLTLQSQQEVYTTQVMQTLATTLLADQSRKTKERQGAMNQMLYRNTQAINDSVGRVSDVALSFTALDGESEPLDLGLFDY